MRKKRCAMRFPGGKAGALTLSYDDGVQQDLRLIGLCDRYGTKCTFHLNSGRFGRRRIEARPDGTVLDRSCVTEAEAARIYAAHEVGGHGLWHSDLTGIGSPAAMREIIDDRLALEALTGAPVTSFSYPYGAHNETVREILRLAGYRCARTTASTGGFAIPRDFLQWDPTCHHDDPRLMDLAEAFCAPEPDAFPQPRLFCLWGHSYEFDAHGNWDTLERFLAFCAQARERIWFASCGEIADYVEAFRALRWSADGETAENPTARDLWLSAGAGGVRKIPAGASARIPPES